MLRHLTLSAMLVTLLASAGCDDLKIHVKTPEVRHHQQAKAWLIYQRNNEWKSVPLNHKQQGARWVSTLGGQHSVVGQGLVLETSSLAPGTHQLTFQGKLENPMNKKLEDAKPQNNGQATITVRNTRPTLTISSPTASAEFGVGQTVALRASAADPGEDGTLSGSRIAWSSDRHGALGNGSSIDVDFLRGDQGQRTLHILTARVTDSGGATTEQTVAVYVVNQPPTVTIQGPAQQTVKVMQPVSLSGSAHDPDGAPPALSWSSDRDGLLGTGAALTTDALSGGRHVITLRATDAATGVAGSASVVVDVQNQLPSARITSPTMAQVAVTETVQLAVSADDPDGAPLDANKVVWSSSLQGQLGLGFALSRSLVPGTHTITAAVTDAHGGRTTAQKTLTVVNQDPVATIRSPGFQSTFSVADAIPFRVDASDPDGWPIADVRWLRDHQPIGAGLALTASLPPGTHVVTAVVTDAHGGQTRASVVVTVTNSAPVARIDSPFFQGWALEYASDAEIEFRATVTDPEDNVREQDMVWISDEDGELHRGREFRTDALSPGKHLITLRVTDSYGLADTASLTLTITNQEPTARVLLPREGDSQEDGTLELVGTGQDPEDGLSLPEAAFVWRVFRGVHGGPGGHAPGAGGPGGAAADVLAEYPGREVDVDVRQLVTQHGEGFYRFVLVVTDSDGAEGRDVVRRIRLETNDAPEITQVTISETTFPRGTVVRFAASAYDPETQQALDGEQLVWKIREKGLFHGTRTLGKGAVLELPVDRRPDTYEVWVTAVDPRDASLTTDSGRTRVRILPPAQPTATQPAAGAADALDAATGGGN